MKHKLLITFCLLAIALPFQPSFATEKPALQRWAQKLLDMHKKADTPNIVLVSMPDPVSASWVESLQQSLAGYQISNLEVNNLGKDIINRYAKFFSKKAQIANDHAYAHELDFRSLRKYSDKLVVVFNDPREMLLEYIDNLSKQQGCELNVSKKLYELDQDLCTPAVPSNFYTLDKSKQLDWAIDNILPHYIAWSIEWLDVVDKEKRKENGIDILVVNSKELIDHSSTLFSEIINHYRIARDKINSEKVPNQINTTPASIWRSAYTDDQLIRISKMMPKQLLQRFGWQE